MRFKRFIICFLLLFTLCLTACSASSSYEVVEETLLEYYWRAETERSYPLGLDASICGVAANEDTVFLCGNAHDRPVLAVMRCEIEDNKCKFSNLTTIDFPEFAEGSRAVALSYGAGRFYVLFSVSDEGAEETQLVYIFTPDGTTEAILAVDLGKDTPKSILVLNDGAFWVLGVHTICRYSAEGIETARYSDYDTDFAPALLIDGEAVFVTNDYENNCSYLNRFDETSGSLVSIKVESELKATTAICQSALGTPLISADGDMYAISDDYTVSHLFNWDEFFDANTRYRYVWQLGEDAFLLVPRDENEIIYQMEGKEHGASAELICLTKSYVPDERQTVRIAFYGRVTELLGTLESRYAHRSPDYRVEILNYSADDEGLNRIMRDVSTTDKIDIVVSDGHSIDASAGFADLYPFIDADSVLSREDFLPQMLAGLENNGKLHEIWGGFSISALRAMGVLADKPAPLRLAECRDYLDTVGYTEPLFSDWVTKTTLLSWLTPGMLKSAYVSEGTGYKVDNDSIRDLLDMCAARPDEADFENSYISEVLEYTDLQPDYLNNLIVSGKPVRLFDGADGGDSFTSLVCDYQSGYMIPKTCADKERAWGYLRIMLTEQEQLNDFNKRRICYPANVAALERVLQSYNSPETESRVYALIENAAIRTPENIKAEEIFTQSVLPYLYGDADIDTALKLAQSKLNIYAAEQAQ